LVVTLGYLLWRRMGGGAALNRQSGSTVLPREISAILDQAMLLRSRIDMSFHPISTSRQTISCSLFELSQSGITLEMPIGVNPSNDWIGKRMVCFFRIPRENKAPYFYTFVSTVTGVWQKGDIHYLVLAIPPKVELGQKAQTPPAGNSAPGHQGLSNLAGDRGRNLSFRVGPRQLARPLRRLYA
jgi:hypothetical protein